MRDNTRAMNTVRWISTNYPRLSTWLLLISAAGLVVSFGLYWYWRKYDPLVAEGERCTNEASFVREEPSLFPLDDAGILRVLPKSLANREFLVGQPICVVVAGVAQALGGRELANALALAEADLEEKDREYNAAFERYQGAKKKADDADSDARQKAAAAETAETKAQASEQNKSAQAEGDRKAADEARRSADAATQAKTAAIKAEHDAKAAMQTALDNKKPAVEKNLAALETKTKGLPPVELTPFLDQHRASDSTRKVPAVPTPQAVAFDFGTPADANTTVAAFWRDVLSGGTDWGTKKVALGLARKDYQVSEMQSAPTLTIRVYYLGALIFGGIGILSLSLAMVLLAIYTSLLRNNNLTFEEKDFPKRQKLQDARKAAEDRIAKSDPKLTPEDIKKKVEQEPEVIAAKEECGKSPIEKVHRLGLPSGTWSLGRIQMALWMLIILAGYLFFWFALGQYANVINASILVLLGLNATTGLLAVSIEGTTNDIARTNGFVSDILSDGGGYQLQRLQVVLWTVVLALVFIWTIAYRFSFVAFDTNLLLLMGIAQATYIGFKSRETPKGLQAKSIEPQTTGANQPTIFTIKGANLAGATAVEFVLGTNTKPISTFKSSADEELVFDATLDKGKWTVNVKSAAGESVTLAQTVAVT
jgi:hypothetical protein